MKESSWKVLGRLYACGMYGKHYEHMYKGSMVGAGAVVFAVWGYVISHVRPPEYEVELNPTILSCILGEPEEKVVEAITKLCSPDPKSRTGDQEGRRMVQRGPFLYHVVNGEAYHMIRTEQELRAYWRDQKYRNKVIKKKKELDPSPESDTTCLLRGFPLGVKIPKVLADSVEFCLWWKKWLEHLTAKRSKPSPHAQQLQLAKLEKMGLERAMKAIEHSITSNWKGIYEPFQNQQQPPITDLPGLGTNGSEVKDYL